MTPKRNPTTNEMIAFATRAIISSLDQSSNGFFMRSSFPGRRACQYSVVKVPSCLAHVH